MREREFFLMVGGIIFGILGIFSCYKGMKDHLAAIEDESEDPTWVVIRFFVLPSLFCGFVVFFLVERFLMSWGIL